MKQPPVGTGSDSRIRVLIADDHVTVLEGLNVIINRNEEMQVVAAASDGREAVALWQQHRPDVTLVDIRMPGLDGVEVIEEIRRLDNSARVVVLTTCDTDNEIYRAVKAGARAYLLKDGPREELVDTIRRVHRGETCLAPSLVEKLAASVSNEPLTRREQEVLELLAKGRSNKEIASTLSISEPTVKTHLRSLFSKLDVLSRTEAIAVASRKGLVRGKW
ncbi:response regulator transcription factor [Verrucomicrobium sp. BvORR034]|uniref:response regulator n=1 Tax=Verrucomicrobium sp. BvORR034 TaxID=1396418 RepID=UPI000678BAEC|nr:response regulator transcription factor [Verrucomicrobium sp. BvORR034]